MRFLLAALLLFCAAAGAAAEEEIRFFRSDVTVRANGDYLVTETIQVRAEGRNIKRGIYRDFPVTFEIASGATGRNAFELVSAKRDGQAENTRIERGRRLVRVYLGQQDVFLSPGVYTYELTYRTDRQVRFFDGHDEIYWNATGTEWIFPIARAAAVIRLPDGASVEDTFAVTGRFGSTDENARSVIGADGLTVSFETTQPLGPREGLTVGVKLAKGLIAVPSAQQQFAWYLRDNMATVISGAGLTAIFCYYLFAWVRVGRDPPRGVVVPRWDLPDGVSPALTHYIWNKGFKGKGFGAISAAAINLAVKGYLELEDIGETLTIRRTDKPLTGGRLPVGEAALLKKIESRGSALIVNKANGKSVQTMASRFRTAMEGEHRAVFYRANTGWIVPGVVASVAIVVATLAFGNLDSDTVGLLIPGIVFGSILTFVIVRMAKQARSGLAGKVQLAFFLFAGLIFVMNSGLFTLANSVFSIGSPAVVGALVSIVMVNVLFFFLIGAPTTLGRRRTDEIEGLKMYLTAAERERMNMAGAPEMSPQQFETLLPYAVALGVEKPWSNAFQTWLATATAAGAAVAAGYYGPRWYRGGSDFSADRIGNTMGGLASSMSDSFTASLPQPKSSSSGFSGGGGSSGGGGGGGGGGGW
ncbi:DUF2207 domain-containing protein [Oricola sp.]|uniref:DUF2207 domain-containing protein n=1 Tax=Oricola sp. TaxID=1979950 RepID=UPI003BABA074